MNFAVGAFLLVKTIRCRDDERPSTLRRRPTLRRRGACSFLPRGLPSPSPKGAGRTRTPAERPEGPPGRRPRRPTRPADRSASPLGPRPAHGVHVAPGPRRAGATLFQLGSWILDSRLIVRPGPAAVVGRGPTLQRRGPGKSSQVRAGRFLTSLGPEWAGQGP